MTNRAEVEAWVYVLGDLLRLAPPAAREAIADALAEQARKRAAAGIVLVSVADMAKDWERSPLRRCYGRIMRIRSRCALACVRAITNTHSRADAARVLFKRHPGPGSGYLPDYLEGLPGMARKRAKDGRNDTTGHLSST